VKRLDFVFKRADNMKRKEKDNGAGNLPRCFFASFGQV